MLRQRPHRFYLSYLPRCNRRILNVSPELNQHGSHQIKPRADALQLWRDWYQAKVTGMLLHQRSEAHHCVATKSEHAGVPVIIEGRRSTERAVETDFWTQCEDADSMTEIGAIG